MTHVSDHLKTYKNKKGISFYFHYPFTLNLLTLIFMLTHTKIILPFIFVDFKQAGQNFKRMRVEVCHLQVKRKKKSFRFFQGKALMIFTKQKCVLKHFFGRVALNIAQEDFIKGMLPSFSSLLV